MAWTKEQAAAMAAKAKAAREAKAAAGAKPAAAGGGDRGFSSVTALVGLAVVMGGAFWLVRKLKAIQAAGGLTVPGITPSAPENTDPEPVGDLLDQGEPAEALP